MPGTGNLATGPVGRVASGAVGEPTLQPQSGTEGHESWCSANSPAETLANGLVQSEAVFLPQLP